MFATMHIYRQMCIVTIQLKIITMPPLLHGCFWYFCGAKIALQLFSSTAASALSTIMAGLMKLQQVDEELAINNNSTKRIQ